MALRNKIARCSGSRSFFAINSSGNVEGWTRGILDVILIGINRPVTESEMDGLRDIESIDLERVRILGMYAVGGRAWIISRFEVEAAGR